MNATSWQAAFIFYSYQEMLSIRYPRSVTFSHKLIVDFHYSDDYNLIYIYIHKDRWRYT
jgi:hypothetical protein